MADPEVHLHRIREICLALPGADEKVAWGEPTFRVNGRIFAMAGFTGSGRARVWCKSDAELRDALIASDPGHYFSPPYVGHKGWIGIVLDADTDWESAADLIEESYLTIGAKKTTSRARPDPKHPEALVRSRVEGSRREE